VKALVLTAPGSLDNLQVAEIPTPEPGPGDMRVRVRAVGLNPVDYQLAATGYPSWTYPFVLGLDVAGEVDARLAVTGAIAPRVSDVLALSDIPRGLAMLAGRHVRGKLVVRL
jgi:NADPH:quinone reductase-like Zn-dependent oxidoreductase